MSANKPAAKKKWPRETAERQQVPPMPVETMTIDVIEEPAPGVIAVTEYEAVRMAPSISSDGEPERGESAGLTDTPT